MKLFIQEWIVEPVRIAAALVLLAAAVAVVVALVLWIVAALYPLIMGPRKPQTQRVDGRPHGSPPECDCGGFPHGKHCAAVVAGLVEHTPTTPNGE